MIPYFLIFSLIGSFLFAVLLMPLCIKLAFALDIVDRPTHRKIHIRPTPYLGGLGLLLGIFFVLPILYFFPTNDQPSVNFHRVLYLVLPSIGAALLGLMDDKFVVRARLKLLTQIVIALACAGFLFSVETVLIPGWGSEDLNDLGIPITVAWFLGVINGVNLVDGVDGLSGTVTAIIYATIAWLALNIKTVTGVPDPDWAVAVLAFAGCGASLGFLAFNWNPAKIYFGDTGSLASGTLIAVLLLCMGSQLKIMQPAASVNALPHEAFPYHFAIISLVVTYPLVEISLTIIRRYLAGKPIGSADKGHIHHRLMKRGWSAQMVCGAAAIISLIAFGIVASVRVHYHGLAVWLLLAEGILGVLMLHFCGFLEMFHPRSIQGSRPHFLIANHFTSMQMIKLDLARDISDVLELTNQTCIEFGVAKYSLSLSHPSRQVLSGDIKCEQIEWLKPASVHGVLLLATELDVNSSNVLKVFSDKFEQPDGSSVFWTFEPHVIEDEMDVEYRVLVSDYMKKALKRACVLSEQKSVAVQGPRNAGEVVTSVSSTALRRRDTQNTSLTSGRLPADNKDK